MFTPNCRAIVEKLDRAAGLNHREITGRSLWLAGKLSSSMTSHWEMRVALAAFEAEALAIAPLHAWGLVLPMADGLVSYQMRHQWGTHVNMLPVADLPPGLRTPIFGVRQITHRRERWPIEAVHVTIGVGALLAIPMPGDLGLFWAGTASNEPLSRRAGGRARHARETDRRTVARARVRRRARGPARAARIARPTCCR